MRLDILTQIERQQDAYFTQAVRREEESRAAQQYSAQIAGHRNGKYLVSVDGGGFTEATALSNSSFRVGSLVSYYTDGSQGFIDQMGVR